MGGGIRRQIAQFASSVGDKPSKCTGPFRTMRAVPNTSLPLHVLDFYLAVQKKLQSSILCPQHGAQASLLQAVPEDVLKMFSQLLKSTCPEGAP